MSLSASLSLLNPIGTAQAAGFEEERDKPRAEVPSDPIQELRNERYGRAVNELQSIDPTNPALYRLVGENAQATEEEIASVEQATLRAKIVAWRAEESRSEQRSPLDPPPERPQSALERYYGNPHFPGPFESALYPEIEAGPEGLTIEPEGRGAKWRGDSYENGIIGYNRFAGPATVGGCGD